MENTLNGPCFEIRGGNRLNGAITVSGSKNASLPIMAAALLTRGQCLIRNVPDLADTSIMSDVLRSLGAKVTFDKNEMLVDAAPVNSHVAPFEMMNRMRASIYVMGPLLALYGKARVALPGGCAIGSRPIDYHLRGFEQMGAKLSHDHGYIEASCPRLRGEHIYLDFPSVGATANLMMAAALADGATTIENAAEEPHIVDLAWFMRSMGAKIRGAGTKTIVVEGVDRLHGAEHDIIPDQIEAGTYMVAAAITRSTITLRGAFEKDLKSFSVKLKEAGVSIREAKGEITVSAKKKVLPVRITTLPHPGFPTDMQPQFMALLATADGVSIIRETVWENRFMHVAELIRMGAEIDVQGNSAVVVGNKKLVGCEVSSPDLRAGAALVLAGLAASDTTKVYGLDHIDRGYENFAEKLSAAGADIKRIS